MYSRCPRQYRFRYLQGIKVKPDVGMKDGLSHHTAVEQANRQLIESRAATAADLMDWRAAAFDALDKEGGEIPGPKERARLDDAAAEIYTKYVPEIQNSGILRPREVEKRFEAPYLGRQVMGVVDVLQDDGAVLDYKRTTKAKSADVIKRLPQLHIYGDILGTKSAGHIQFVVADKPKVVFTPVTLEKEDKEKVRKWADSIMTAIDQSVSSGVWPRCSPDCWQCSPRFCGYYKMCFSEEEESKVADILLETAKYLNAAVVERYAPIKVKVVTVQPEEVGKEDEKEEKFVVYFEGVDGKFPCKGLVLGATNRDTLVELYGSETDNWIGKECVLEVVDTKFGNRKTRGVRVMPPSYTRATSS